ncbi:MAG: RNA methyltransferase [Prolixibacteraceae bacterium]|nr:RNA methyltransferase [Prolixibacteraceae bacterium]
MISKNTIKLIKSLSQKKFRQHENLFLAEGDKIVSEVLKSAFKIEYLYATNEFLTSNWLTIKNATQIVEVSKEDIKKASQLKNPQNSLALCRLPIGITFPERISDLTLYLDGIQDPGNLGTIIRVCDWFGISQLFCSHDTVDVFNPKVIQATMGSFCRVQIHPSSFNKVYKIATKSNAPVIGAFIDGENMYTQELSQKALLVMGNEGNGISVALEKQIDKRISIPQFSEGAESLNVAIAASIICSEFRRRLL